MSDANAKETDGNGSGESSCYADDFESVYHRLSDEDKRWVMLRCLAQPVSLFKRPRWQRVLRYPIVWWSHYKISRTGMNRLDSVRSAFVWSNMVLYKHRGDRSA